MPQTVQKLLCNCTASNKPESSSVKGEPAPQGEMQMLLPSITLGLAQRGTSVPKAVQEQCDHFLLCLLAGSQPSCHSGPGCSEGDKHANVMCSSARLGTLLRSRWQSQTRPQLSLAAAWAHQLRACRGELVAVEVARCPGALSLPSLRGVWNVPLGTGLLGSALGAALSAGGWWWPVPDEPLLSGTFPGELALPADRLEQLAQILAGCCCLWYPPGRWIPPPQRVLREQGAAFWGALAVAGGQSSAREAEREHLSRLLLPPERFEVHSGIDLIFPSLLSSLLPPSCALGS